ncbi:MAG: ABC transporter ATP-binding protein [Deferribacterota bacterium]|nr:ABC transporter ATP-binding protein [Deferribacterota bacterium]
MLEIKNLYVQVDDKLILKGVDLKVKEGDVIILMGPNGSGKTTLLHTIMGLPRYKIIDGQILFNNIDITNMMPDERARLGIGIMFQKAPSIRGVTLGELAYIISRQDDEEVIRDFANKINVQDYLDREVNFGFSGGELKRSEVFQLLCNDSKLVLLDEPESGVDIENIALISENINRLLGKDEKIKKRYKSGIIVTHTGYILDYVNADKGYIMFDGKIVCEGGPRDILEEVRKNGYRRCGECK